MNIPNIPNNHTIHKSDSTKDTVHRKTNPVSDKRDVAEIGEESRILAKLKAQLKQLQNNVNPELEKLQHKIMMGTYSVSSEQIARAVLYGSPKS